MNRELLMLVDAISREKSVDLEIVFQAVEAALASASKKLQGGEVDIRPILRGATDTASRFPALATAMTDCVRLKPDVHSRHGNEQMSRIGG